MGNVSIKMKINYFSDSNQVVVLSLLFSTGQATFSVFVFDRLGMDIAIIMATGPLCDWYKTRDQSLVHTLLCSCQMLPS